MRYAPLGLPISTVALVGLGLGACGDGSSAIEYSDIGVAGSSGSSGMDDPSGDAGSASTNPAAPEPVAACAEDICPREGGVRWRCRDRFMYGANLAWVNFAADFGGIKAWEQAGVSNSRSSIARRFREMHEHGVSVIRWWMIPDFRGDAVVFSSNETPTGIGGTLLEDIDAALELAAQEDVYLMLTLFSFDAFRPTRDVGDPPLSLRTPSLAPIARDDAKRQALINEVVRPVAARVEASPYKRRLVAWDVINEPEWAISGKNPYGDPAYTPDREMDAVEHVTMEEFLAETILALREESNALVSVGAAAMKWRNAWSQLDVDFHQFHYYGWVQDFWPYDRTPEFYGVDDKPVVMGEFPVEGLPEDGLSFGDLVNGWWNAGYAGALSWDWAAVGPDELTAIRYFGETNACATRY